VPAVQAPAPVADPSARPADGAWIVHFQPAAPGAPAAPEVPLSRNSDDNLPRVQIHSQPPGPDRLFRLESEQALDERIRIETSRPGGPAVVFPEEPHQQAVASRPNPYHGGPPKVELAEPNCVCYRRLMFEQINTERYGWDLGPAEPFFCAGVFYADMVTAPLRRLVAPCRCYECSAGYCLPDDPVPFEVLLPSLPFPADQGSPPVRP